MQVFIIIGIVGFVLAAIFNGTFVSGDRQRANFYSETKEDRHARGKATDWLMLGSVISFGIAALIYWLS
ncbi:hypothetical protein FHS18_000497 [Paenibacillus phyllosphaerae]|uniref:Uncharacterized protein n=1 Tax=Paenibacillus phyllosphaerae TaxID=274593 RepID=A0A7W5ATG6_9BACL|nr:DUF5316 family protein [Paenibacillus phyllosphaerae]MBB3108469.1 hypothetical protein [Paenibacillus phyllosphaerae]